MARWLTFLFITIAVSAILYQNNEITNERILHDKIEKQNEELRKQEILAKTAQKAAEDMYEIEKSMYELEKSAAEKLEKLLIETSKQPSCDSAQNHNVIEFSVWKKSGVKDSLIQGMSRLPQQYYDVINVNNTDALNIRQQPSPNSKIVGQIPSDGRCISYLNELEILEGKGKCQVFFKMEYNGIQGWINSYFITGSSTECPVNVQEKTTHIQE